MQITREQVEPTKVKLSVVADQAALTSLKQTVLERIAQNIKVPGFRPGKAPAPLVEKQVDQAQLQAEFVDEAVNKFYVHAIEQEKLRPVASPEINLTKFVPFSTLEFTAEVETVGAITLADYKKIKLPLKKTEVNAEDVKNVLNDLAKRAASKKTVTRAAKLGDEITIDYTGSDAKTNEPIAGTDGTDYPLVLGSQQFIPGFEDELVGLKSGGEKTFTLTFPKDYGVVSLQSRRVQFSVIAKQVQELTQPKLDDAFAATIGPFKTLAELKSDIKKQLTIEKQREATQAYDNELLEKIAAKSEVAIPEALVEEEISRIEEDEKRNTAYRGQTWQEHLDAEGVSAEEHRERQRPAAELRIKAGLILGEIAEREQITVTPEELEVRIMLLKNQYTDDAMVAELDKPENRRDITSRMLTEKTLDKLRTYATN